MTLFMRYLPSLGHSIWNPWNELAEAQAIFLFHRHHGFGHGMINSLGNPAPFHMESIGIYMEWGHIHLRFHEITKMDSMEQVQFHGNSTGIPTNNSIWLSKIVPMSRIKDSAFLHMT